MYYLPRVSKIKIVRKMSKVTCSKLVKVTRTLFGPDINSDTSVHDRECYHKSLKNYLKPHETYISHYVHLSTF